MAESPAHQFGQIIGGLLEDVVLPQLNAFCAENSLYLDYQKNIRKARGGKKVSWFDSYGNKHDLDFVIEKGGTDEKIGSPLAFIESAWRRYTKHSKNKAQEIQGAILPLAEKYRWNNLFLGAVLAGEFTESSLKQLESMGFQVLYFPYESLVKSFAAAGVDIAFDEDTEDEVFKRAVEEISIAKEELLGKIRKSLVKDNKVAIGDFFKALAWRLSRRIVKILVLPLYGSANEFLTLDSAMSFLDGYYTGEGSGDFRKYEIKIEFSNGDRLDALFEDKVKAKRFLEFVAGQ